jgi:hypothetical protein
VDPSSVDHACRRRGLEDVVQFRLWLSSVRWYEHRAGQPDAEHGEDEFGAIGELNHHGLARFDTGRTQPSPDSGGFHARGARRNTEIDGVDQVFTIGERMLRQQIRQAPRGSHHDPPAASANGSELRSLLTVRRWMKGSDKETSFPEASHRSGLPAEMNCTLYSFRPIRVAWHRCT